MTFCSLEDEQKAPRQIADPADLMEALVWNDFLAILGNCLHVLTEKQARVIELYYYEGLNFEQAGKAMHVSEQAASQLHARAMITLKRQMKSLKIHKPADVL